MTDPRGCGTGPRPGCCSRYVGRVRRLLALCCAGLLAASALAGCGGSSTPKAAKAPTAKPTPIEQLNTGAMRLARVDFCGLVPNSAIEQAAGKSAKATRWQVGDRVMVGTGDLDAVDEFGCAWTKGDVRAAAWVYAVPMSYDDANAVLAKTAKRPGCTVGTDPNFGSPSQLQICATPARARLSGLFSDTFLVCEISGTGVGEPAIKQLERFCVAVASADNLSS